LKRRIIVFDGMRPIDALRTLTALSVVGCGGLADRVSQPKSDDSGAFSQPYLAVSVYDPLLPLVTARDPGLPVRLVSGATADSPMSFAGLLQDRTLGESVIRSLVTISEMPSGAPVDYAVGNPIRNPDHHLETLDLTPVTPFAATGWYRVTLYPGETQQLVSCRTLANFPGVHWLTVPQSTDFYTCSRPMVTMVSMARQAGGTGSLSFVFSEALLYGDLDANPEAIMTIDGVVLSGCVTPYACSRGSLSPPGGWPSMRSYQLAITLTAAPASFTEITLAIPLALSAEKGGSVLDGTLGNPQAKVDGDWAVYSFKAVDMDTTASESGSKSLWYYRGP
jgi:hypothetical protein